MYIYIYIYIYAHSYVCACVCVCVCREIYIERGRNNISNKPFFLLKRLNIIQTFFVFFSEVVTNFEILRMRVYTHTHTRARVRAHTHTETLTHTHMHAQGCLCAKKFFFNNLASVCNEKIYQKKMQTKANDLKLQRI